MVQENQQYHIGLIASTKTNSTWLQPILHLQTLIWVERHINDNKASIPKRGFLKSYFIISIFDPSEKIASTWFLKEWFHETYEKPVNAIEPNYNRGRFNLTYKIYPMYIALTRTSHNDTNDSSNKNTNDILERSAPFSTFHAAPLRSYYQDFQFLPVATTASSHLFHC